MQLNSYLNGVKGYNGIVATTDDGERMGYLNWWKDKTNGKVWINFLFVNKEFRGSPVAIRLLREFQKEREGEADRFFAWVASKGILRLLKRVFGNPIREGLIGEGDDISFFPKKSKEILGDDGCEGVHCPVTYEVEFWLNGPVKNA
jgi:hypothetical protein